MQKICFPCYDLRKYCCICARNARKGPQDGRKCCQQGLFAGRIPPVPQPGHAGRRHRAALSRFLQDHDADRGERQLHDPGAPLRAPARRRGAGGARLRAQDRVPARPGLRAHHLLHFAGFRGQGKLLSDRSGRTLLGPRGPRAPAFAECRGRPVRARALLRAGTEIGRVRE